MSAPMYVACPHCHAAVDLTFAAAIGDRVACPKCSNLIPIESRDDADVARLGADKWVDDQASADRQRKSIAKPNSKHLRLIAGGTVAGFVLMGGLVLIIEPQQVLTLYKQLPESLKREKAFLLHRLGAAQQIGDVEYTAVLEDYQKYFPSDPTLDLIRLDYWTMRNDFRSAVEGLKRLETAMGGTDGYLHGLLAIQLVKAGDLVEARMAAEEAMRMEPDQGIPYQGMVMTCLKEEKNDEALRYIKLLFENARQQFLGMETDLEFEGFRASPQYEEWQKYLLEQAALIEEPIENG